jgi:hypothetical protein
MIKWILGLLFAALIIVVATLNQTTSATAGSRFDPLRAFAPFDWPQPANRYRSANGAPGPDYWQNRADYEIHAQLDPDRKELIGREIITYTNNSPDTLTSLWIQLDQNTYREDARSVAASSERRRRFTEGFVLDEVRIERNGQVSPASYRVSDTRLQIVLPEALKPAGGLARVHIQYHYTVPGLFGDRTSWVRTRNGDIFDIAQWYPRMAVYDDVRGWDTLPYMAQEFYLEYGSFDYYITVPWNMLVAASGELQNPEEVLTLAQRQRLEAARSSDETVVIRTAGEINDPASRPQNSGTLTWHYRMENTRDVAFSASTAFIWDAARIQLPDQHSALAMSLYPIESAGDAAWGRSTEYLKHAVEEFSRRWTPYPYPVAINIAGGTTGMEYPAILFDGIEDKGKDLFWITAHEIGHTWFPMMVGFDERRDAWMDEGFNTFIDVYESDAFQKGVYGPKRDSEYAPHGGNPVDEILRVLADSNAPVLLTRADLIPEKYRHPITYFKSALGLILLREQILGPERFDTAFKRFIRDWAFRHPKPADFFRAMESEGGEDLSWFWRGWYQNNWTLDLAVQSISYVDDDPSEGAVVKIQSRDPLIMPVKVRIDFRDGSRQEIRVPAEAWIQSAVATLNVQSTEAIDEVTLDPDHVIPDKDRGNNVLKKKAWW